MFISRFEETAYATFCKIKQCVMLATGLYKNRFGFLSPAKSQIVIDPIRHGVSPGQDAALRFQYLQKLQFSIRFFYNIRNIRGIDFHGANLISGSVIEIDYEKLRALALWNVRS